MPRFFTKDIDESNAKIVGDDAHHIAKALRMRVGELLEVCDESGNDYRCELTQVTQDFVIAKVLEKVACKSETRVKLSLFQALPKADKLELIAQKAVELGVSEITPVITSRCISRWDEKDAAKKIARIQKIMLEAAKQSGRGTIPTINTTLGFEAAISRMKDSSCAILFYEAATTPLREILGENMVSVSIMTGSEGGFSPEEAEFAAKNNLAVASLGTRILRCETAALCALSAINYAFGEF